MRRFGQTAPIGALRQPHSRTGTDYTPFDVMEKLDETRSRMDRRGFISYNVFEERDPRMGGRPEWRGGFYATTFLIDAKN